MDDACLHGITASVAPLAVTDNCHGNRGSVNSLCWLYGFTGNALYYNFLLSHTPHQKVIKATVQSILHNAQNASNFISPKPFPPAAETPQIHAQSSKGSKDPQKPRQCGWWRRGSRRQRRLQRHGQSGVPQDRSRSRAVPGLIPGLLARLVQKAHPRRWRARRFHVCEQFCSVLQDLLQRLQELQDYKPSDRRGQPIAEPGRCQPRQPTVHANAYHASTRRRGLGGGELHKGGVGGASRGG